MCTETVPFVISISTSSTWFETCQTISPPSTDPPPQFVTTDVTTFVCAGSCPLWLRVAPSGRFVGER